MKNRLLAGICIGIMTFAMAFCVSAAENDTEVTISNEDVQVTDSEDNSNVRLGDNGKYYLYDENNVLVANAGTPIVNGAKYWVNSDGSLNSGYLKLGDWLMYFDTETYQAKTGLAQIGDKHYLFNADGVLYAKAGTPVVEGAKYWFKEDGSLGSGYLKLGDWLMYFDPETFQAKTSLAQIGNKHYLFNSDGVLYAKAGTPVVEGAKYWFKEDGSLGSGYLKLGDWLMYFDLETFQAKTGLAQIGDKHYLFNSDGVLYAKAGTPVVEGAKYWFKEDGSLGSGWLILGNMKMYFDPTTFKGAVGVVTIEGKELIFDDNGVWFPGPGSVWANGVRYKVDEDGTITKDMTAAMRYAKEVLDSVGWDLRAAYNWSASMPYYRYVGSVPAGRNHSEWYAEYGFKNRTGNCYVMAATFVQMARLLGYDAYLVEGEVPLARGGMGPHGWCEIDMNGTTYVFDPDFTYNTGRNGFQITYGTSGTWRYTNYERVS